MNTREQTAKNARAVTRYAVGMCAKFTRTMLGAPAVGDVDGDGDADAVDQWRASKHRVSSSTNAPLGLPFYWAGGSKGYGHAAVGLGGDLVRSTDMDSSGRYAPGRVSTVRISDVNRAMGMTPLGYTKDYNGTLIPSEDDGGMELRVATYNMKELPKMSNGKVDADLLKVDKSGAELVLYQEAANTRYRQRIAKVKRLKMLILRKGGDFDVPIGYDPRVITPHKSASTVRVQEGWVGVTPNRYLASQRFYAGTSKKDPQFVARDVHPIAGAWNSTGGSDRKGATVPRRQREWRRSRKIILRRLRAAAVKGTPQILGADTNRQNLGLNFGTKLMGRRVQKVSHGFDFIYFIDGKKYGWELVGSKDAIKTNSDHRLVVQTARLVKLKKG